MSDADISDDAVMITIGHLQVLHQEYGHIIGYQSVTVDLAIEQLRAFLKRRWAGPAITPDSKPGDVCHHCGGPISAGLDGRGVYHQCRTGARE